MTTKSTDYTKIIKGMNLKNYKVKNWVFWLIMQKENTRYARKICGQNCQKYLIQNMRLLSAIPKKMSSGFKHFFHIYQMKWLD